MVAGREAGGPQSRLILTPIAPAEREPILDVLRGFAVLGILLVNIEVMRGPDWLGLMDGDPIEPSGAWDAAVRFAIGWFASGKFLSSLAILFGVGAALISARSLRAGESPRPLLARRYLCLAAFGLAHMLVYPGDILFLYGLTGLALLPFVRLRVGTALLWSAAIGVAYCVLTFFMVATVPEAADAHGAVESTEDLKTEALTAFASGSVASMLAAHASQSLYLQPQQLVALPWILALFLFGFAIARAGVTSDFPAHRALLKRGAWLGLVLGVPANFVLGFGGPLPGWGAVAAEEPAWLTNWTTLAIVAGAPVLAVGYLCTIALACLRSGASRRLAAVGRMALTAYLMQSVLALAVFGGLRLYDGLSTAAALLVVAAIWTILLIACPLWLRAFRIGPAEWLWRSAAYGRIQPVRTL